MAGLITVTHGNVGASMIDCIIDILGKKPHDLVNLSVNNNDNPDLVYKKIKHLITRVDRGQGTLIMTDVYGATPSNIVKRLVNPGKIECISGVNISMLLKAVNYQTLPLELLLEKTLAGGTDGILRLPEVEEL